MMKILKGKGGLILVAFFSFVPVFLWAFAQTFSDRFSDFTQFLLSLGQITGLIGTALYAITLFLSARLRFFEKLFGGLNQVYVRHSQLGQMALILMLFHPLLLLPKYTENWNDAMLFFLPSSNWAQTWGLLSLVLMIVLIVLTLYLRPRYNIWKWTHKFLGLAFFLGALHVWMIPSDTSRFLPLRIYILSLAAIGLLAFFYRTIFGFILVKKFKYKVVGIKRLNESITEISLKATKEAMKFKAGQFIFIQFAGSALGTEPHPFSIVSAPYETVLRLGIKNLGDYTSELELLNVGDEALVEGPFGNFTMAQAQYKNQIWIAGGIGITPFISLAHSIPKNEDYNIDLFYCVRNEDEAAYRQELDALSQQNPSLRFHLFCSEKSGRIDATHIQTATTFLSNKDILMCAPPPMIHSLRSQFIEKGIHSSYIHSEEFNL